MELRVYIVKVDGLSETLTANPKMMMQIPREKSLYDEIEKLSFTLGKESKASLIIDFEDVESRTDKYGDRIRLVDCKSLSVTIDNFSSESALNKQISSFLKTIGKEYVAFLYWC